MPSLRKITPEINFGGGLNTKVSKSMVKDNESTDMQNMISDLDGSSQKRLGTTRYNTQRFSDGYTISMYKYYDTSAVAHYLTLVYDVAQSKSVLFDGSTWVSGQLTVSFTTTGSFFDMLNNIVVLTFGDASAAPFKYDFSTITTLGGSPPQAKFVRTHRDYMFLGYINGSPSKIYYSAFQNPESWDVNGYINVNKNDGQYITGMESLNGVLYIFKNRSIYALNGTVFDPATGDFSITPISTTLGAISPRSIVNNGNFIIFHSERGICVFDGSSVSVISQKVEDRINGIAQADKPNTAGGYDENLKHYWFSYRNTAVSPTTVNNTCLIYDFNLSQWYPIKNINANCFSMWSGDKFAYGESINGGWVNYLNVASTYSDVPLTKNISACEETSGWSGGTADDDNFVEGRYSRYLDLTGSDSDTATVTFTTVKDLTAFNDGTISPTSDYIHFWVYHSTRANVSTVDINLDGGDGSFTNYFYYNIGPSLTAGNNKWTEFNVAKSAFDTVGTAVWSAIKAVRFNATSSGNVIVNLDDVYLKSASNTAINAYRDTKIYDFGNVALVKRFIDLYLYGSGYNSNDVTITAYYQEGDSNKSMTWVNAANTDWLIKSRILREGKNIYFRFANSTIDQSLKLNKMLISYKTKTLR